MKKPIVAKFMAVLMTALTVFVVMGSAAAYAYSRTAAGSAITPDMPNNDLLAADGSDSGNTDDTDLPEDVTPQLNIPEITTALILGVDADEYLTDVIILAVYDATTGSLDLISIPRDTRVVLSDEMKAAYKEIGKSVPSTMKINAIHSYAGKTYGVEFIRNYLEGLYNIEIDYYAKVNMEGFINIIDAVGGIWLDIPQRLYNNDLSVAPIINIPAGYQLLDGETALSVVRFRRYKMGDIGRIDMQHAFLEALFEQVMTKEALLSNPLVFASTMIGYVSTDVGLDDISDYLPVLDTFDPGKITSHTAEGYSDGETYKTSKGEKISYYILDQSAAATKIDDIIEANRNPATETEETASADDIDATASPDADE